MARIEDFLGEARAEALALLEDIAERGGAIVRTTSGSTRGQAGLPVRDRDEWGRFENSIRQGLGQVMSGAGDVLTAASQDRGDAEELPLDLRRIASRTEETARGYVANPRLTRIGACFSATADLVENLSAAEKRRVHDQVATITAHVARASAAAETRLGSAREEERQTLTTLARDLDDRRTTPAPYDLGEAGMRGVPATPLERSLHRWHAVSRDALNPSSVADGVKRAQQVAWTAAQISAAAYRACLTQDGPVWRDRADRWVAQAKVWGEAADAWTPPPVLVSGRVRPDPELTAASRDVTTRIAGDFRDAALRWVPPERLADPDALRRFEHDARQVMLDLGEKYNAAVGSVARSEVIAMPAAQMGRLEGGMGLPPEKRLGGRSWVTMPATDPAALRLIESAAQVEVSSMALNRPGPSPTSAPLGSQPREAARSANRSARDLGATRGTDHGPDRG